LFGVAVLKVWNSKRLKNCSEFYPPKCHDSTQIGLTSHSGRNDIWPPNETPGMGTLNRIKELNAMHKLKIMRSLKRRIEELEKAALALQRDRACTVELALCSLEPDQIELFFSSFDAEDEGRPLSPAESAVRQAYTRALAAKCRSRLPSIKLEEQNPSLQKFLMMVAERPFSAEVFKLAITGDRGQQEGQAELPIEEVGREQRRRR
jgi:hypothetical protein